MTKIELNKKEFIKCLGIGGTFAGKSKLMPILDCVKIKVSNGKIKVVSSDTENAINKSMEVISADNDITFCVDYKSLMSYVKLISADTFTLNVDESNVEIKHDNGKMKLPTFTADDFPILKADDDSKTISVSSALVNNWIIDGRNFTANDTLRPQMNGIYFYAKDGEFGCCATDGKALFTDNVKEDIEDFSFILNRNSFIAVCDVCADVEELTLKVGTNNVMFIGNGNSVLARIQDGRYPNFKAVITTDNPIKVKVDKKEMISAINRCKLGANSASSLIKLETKGFMMDITAEDIDFNKSAVENIPVEAEGSITIGFNADNLLNVLNNVSTDRCVLNMSKSDRPCLVTEDNTESNKIFLQMPMLIE